MSARVGRTEQDTAALREHAARVAAAAPPVDSATVARLRELLSTANTSGAAS
jgi:hypothetical protein